MKERNTMSQQTESPAITVRLPSLATRGRPFGVLTKLVKIEKIERESEGERERERIEKRERERGRERER